MAELLSALRVAATATVLAILDPPRAGESRCSRLGTLTMLASC